MPPALDSKRADILRFDVDGWHARFDDSFTDENVARIADALGLVWANGHPGATVYVGFDTRHAAHDHARLAAGVLASYGLVVKVSDRPPSRGPALGTRAPSARSS